MSAPARFGRYRVERRIGSGSFATVWLAHDEVLEAPVAVKVLADNWAHRLDVRERFEEEARILRRADSDRVVRVHDIGELEDGRPYFVMTYADGGTLADRLAEGPLPVPVALRYGSDVARGLAVLHEVGVIHRDVNPANVLLRSGRAGVGNRVLIADLGLAKAAARGSGFTLTVGTPGYMAPEQLSGGGVSRRTDVYAVGALLWHLLTGAAPDPDAELPPVSLPGPVDAVLRQALARRPEDRFPSATALADALDAAAIELARSPAGSPPAPRPAPAGPTAPAGPDRRPADPEATDTLRTGRPEAEPDVTQVLRPDRERMARPVGERHQAGERRVRRPGEGGERHQDGGRRPRPPSERPARSPGEDTVQLRRSRRRVRRVAWIAVLAVLVAGGAVAYVLVRRERATVDVTAASGLHVSVPASWARQQQAADWDLTPLGAAGKRGTALLVAQDVAEWRDPASATPGVFVGVARGVSEDRLWAVSADHSCGHSQERRELPSGLVGTVRRYECPGSAARVTEAVLTRSGSDLRVFVQVKEPLADDDATAVLDSVTLGTALS
jgi:hypothetical protein